MLIKRDLFESRQITLEAYLNLVSATIWDIRQRKLKKENHDKLPLIFMSPKRKRKKEKPIKIFFVIPFVVEFCDLEEEMLWRQKEKTVATPTPLEKAFIFISPSH